MNFRKNGYHKLIQRITHILEDNPQDIVDDDEGFIYTGGLWELVSAREINEEDDSMSDSLKEELIDNPRKIGSANLLYVQDLVEKLHEDNMEYLVICIQKGKNDSKANAYYSIVTKEGADMMLATINEVFTSEEISELLPRDDDEESYMEGAD